MPYTGEIIPSPENVTDSPIVSLNGYDEFGDANQLKREISMTIDRMILAIAGSFILISTLLSILHHPNWLWFTAFVGANLLQSAFTGFCPMAVVLKKLGLKSGEAFS